MNTEIEKLSTDLATRAAGLAVTDQASANRAAELIHAGKEMIRKIKDFYGLRKAKAHEFWKFECDEEKAELAKVEPILDKLNKNVASWRAEEQRKWDAVEAERLRIEREKKQIEEEALRKAREAEEKAKLERLRLEKEAERLNKEAAKKANDEVALKRIDGEREKLRLQAEESRRIADAEIDKAIDEAAAAEAAMPEKPVIPEAPRTEGLVSRKYWAARINEPIEANVRLLLRGILDNQVSIEAVVPNMPFLNKLAGLCKDRVKIPGVEFFDKDRMAEIGKRTKA